MTEFDGDFGEAGRILAYDPAAPPSQPGQPGQPDGMPQWLLWTLVIGTSILIGLVGLFVLNSAFADPVGGCGGG